MKKQLAIATMMLTFAAMTPAYSQWGYGMDPVQAQGQQLGKRKGNKTGPQDGTGPIHEPGTGGGAGAGQGKGKMTGPRDGSGPIHTPGTGGGTGAGNRRGR